MLLALLLANQALATSGTAQPPIKWTGSHAALTKYVIALHKCGYPSARLMADRGREYVPNQETRGDVIPATCIARWLLVHSEDAPLRPINAPPGFYGLAPFNSSSAAIRSPTYFPQALAKMTCGRYRTPVMSVYRNEWYTRELAAAREPSLLSISAANPRSDVLRFTWLPSNDPTVVVRIDGLRSSSAHLVAKQLSVAGGRGPGTISRRVKRRLTQEETIRFRRITNWLQVPKLASSDCGGADGAQWLVEVVDKAGYHLIDRFSPERGEVHAFGLAALRLTGWKFGRIY